MPRFRHLRSGACVVTLFLLIVGASGCGGAAAKVALDDLPVPPGLKRYNGAAETTLDGMWSAMILGRARPPKERAVDYYWLPRSIRWETVEAFYRQRLDGQWRRDPDHPLIEGGRWTRASVAGEQVLVINSIGINAERGVILMVSLTTE